MAPTNFVGRDAVLRRLFEFLEDPRPARRVLVLEAPRGVGRSALLELMKARSVSRDLLLLRFARRGATPGQQALDLLRSALTQLTDVAPDPAAPVSRWLDPLPPEARAAAGEFCGELHPSGHPARSLRCLVKALEALAGALGRDLTVALDDPDRFGEVAGYPGVPRQGFALTKFFSVSPRLRWVLAPRYPGSLGELAGLDDVEVLRFGRLRRAESYHLAALLLEHELRPVPRALLWPLHGLSDGRPGYLRALVHRLLRDARNARGMPQVADVRAAFLRELLEPMGRLGMACEALAAEDGRSSLGRAVLDLLARRGPLGVESMSQLLGVGRDRVLGRTRSLVRRGLLLDRSGRFVLGDPVLATWLRALAVQAEGDPGRCPALLEEARRLEAGRPGGDPRRDWEARVRDVLRGAEGRMLPGRPFGAGATVLAPAGGVEEAAVGFDARGGVDGRPAIVAADLLLNGRDRRWLVEMPPGPGDFGADEMGRALRMLEFFSRSYRRPIERLWVASRGGFTAEARRLAAREGVLISDEEGVARLEAAVLAVAA